ncbi:hypothetical protein [Sulfitobacter sp. 1A15106]|uniref:hypothetical protein n=1 Tax=Sulfitobacter sp. 1A15106 TaxID=3368590 RepID=UPI003746CB37
MSAPNIRAINDMAFDFHAASLKAGWWKTLQADGTVDPHEVGTKIGLIHSEVSEAMEAFRKDAMDDHLTDRKGVEVEIGDAIIRLLDLAGALRVDVGNAIYAKMAYNAARADHKPEARAAVGGKKF